MRKLFVLTILLGSTCLALDQEQNNNKISIFIQLEKEINKLVEKFEWPGEIPRIQLICQRDVSLAAIYSPYKLIVIDETFLSLPRDCQRFILAHEIAHYQQYIKNNSSLFFDFFSRTASRACILLPILGLPAQMMFEGAYNRLQNIYKKICLSDIKLCSSLIFTKIIYRYIFKYQARQYSQLIELDADKQAIIAINSSQGAINFFRILRQIDIMSDYTQEKEPIFKRGLDKISHTIKNVRRFFFNTHPSHTDRIHYAKELQVKNNFPSGQLLSQEEIIEYAHDIAETRFKYLIDRILSEHY